MVLRRPRIVQIGMSSCFAGPRRTVGSRHDGAKHAVSRCRSYLWSDAINKSPGKARPHNNLGHAYAQQGKWDLAIEEFRIALTLQPDYPLAQQNLLNAYLRHVDRD